MIVAAAMGPVSSWAFLILAFSLVVNVALLARQWKVARDRKRHERERVAVDRLREFASVPDPTNGGRHDGGVL